MHAYSFDLEIAWYATEWLIRIGALMIVPLRRTPSATRAWLLLIFFLPVPGLLLFLAIGSPRFPAWRKQRFRSLLPFFAETADRMRLHAPDLGDAAPIAALAETLGHMPATGGNTVELLDDYDAVVDRLVADIEDAQTSVHLLVYIFADDHVGRRVADALGRAVARGVRVRVMFDPVGSRRWRRGTNALLHQKGVDVREALPFRLIRGRTRRDMRNHRKLFVIDGRIGYAGSQNIVAKDFRPGIVNRELVARLTGPAVAAMEAIVRGDWSLETGEPPEAIPAIAAGTGDAKAQLLPSGAEYPLEGFETLLVWQLHQARDRVIMVTPYFIPDEEVLGAMRAAAARGVTVNLIVSQVVDQRIVNLSQSSYYGDLMAAGVRVNMFRDFLLHAKNVTIDGRLAVVGSSNVDLRSFQLNEEASLLLYDADSIARVEAVQRSYLAASDRLEPERWRLRSPVRKLTENIARLVNSLL
ncbi:cardiolipin synthase [Sphingomonas sp. BIUV-7]|uniref:Cardiolipin synthase n=1 Tax=Sphingomonas natans TaxID=3063330 RepID=A0ABT8YDS3_9SPHN|nr:cardiolipin synthase [Sphingomonas sp. BIUV-7]MDO6415799.1 cardiolipin synthase [Sphingomonas sp. BIUV-7]